MFINYLLLSISISIDSLGIGTTYGLKNTKLSSIAKVIVFSTSFVFVFFSMYLGKFLSSIFPEYICKFIGMILLIFMGIWIILQSFKKEEDTTCKNTLIASNSTSLKNKTIFNFFIKSLGITIKIIRNPITSDLDNSKIIDWKESLYLALALSIDSICVGIGSSMLGFNSVVLPFLAASFSLTFVLLGIKLGKKITNAFNIPSSFWTILSGSLLIVIGLLRGVI